MDDDDDDTPGSWTMILTESTRRTLGTKLILIHVSFHSLYNQIITEPSVEQLL